MSQTNHGPKEKKENRYKKKKKKNALAFVDNPTGSRTQLRITSDPPRMNVPRPKAMDFPLQGLVPV
jgi:hypothetical protein